MSPQRPVGSWAACASCLDVQSLITIQCFPVGKTMPKNSYRVWSGQVYLFEFRSPGPPGFRLEQKLFQATYVALESWKLAVEACIGGSQSFEGHRNCENIIRRLEIYGDTSIQPKPIVSTKFQQFTISPRAVPPMSDITLLQCRFHVRRDMKHSN